MSLPPGFRLGSYEILSPLGAGGMGEVFRARDTKLGRDVALKILPEAFAQDAERLARFEREARTLATLNHPHIAQIHGFEEGASIADGRVSVRALVMELVEGEDLSARIARGPMPLDEALPIARQVAEALGAAHEQGIIHRDLKPANIKVRPDGAVKVLDFGLAKAMDSAAGNRQPAAGLENSPTITSPAMTMQGMILGTAAYMAPEQARGQIVDKRADIWAFGCVFYEMLTGRRPFAGDDLTLTLAAIVKDQADLIAAPRQVRRLLARCLEKDPRRRLRDIGDVFDLLEDAPTSQAQITTPPRRAVGWPWAVAVIVAAVAGALGGARWFEAPSRAAARFLVPWPAESGRADSGEAHFFEVSPDGRYLAIVSQGVVWVRAIDQVDPIRLDRTNGATYPFWSPDSASIGFFADGQMKKILRTGGAVQRICDASTARGGAWGPDGTIVFATDGGIGGLSRVSEAGGAVSKVTTIATPRSSVAHRYPQFLPDGRHFLYLYLDGAPNVGGVYVGSLDGGDPIRILEGREAAQFARNPAGGSGHLLFVQGDTLMAQAFDPAKLRPEGSAFSLVDFVSQGENTGIGRFSTGAGVLAHTSMASAPSELFWFDRNRKRLGRQADASNLFTFALGDADRRLALNISSASGRSTDIWLQSASSASLSKLTFGPAPGWGYSVWSPTGIEVAYATVDNLGIASYEIRRRSVADTNREDVLFRGEDMIYVWDWSPDGQFLVINRASDLWQLPVDGQRTPIRLTNTPDLDEQYGQVSPNGKWLAYTANDDGKERVFVQPVQPTAAKWLITPEGGSMPRWRRDGRVLFFRAPDGRLRAVTVSAAGLSRDSATFEHRDIETLAVAVPSSSNLQFFTYQPSADGERFLVAVPIETAMTPTTVVLNWQAALKD